MARDGGDKSSGGDSFEGHRLLRLQELLLDELRGLVRDDVHDPALSGTVLTALVLSVDYRHARVHFVLPAGDTSKGARDRAEKVFERVTPFLRARVAEALDLRRVPDLRFVFDGHALP
ncbi:MAG: ribosome-binding factor A [Polyangiaceae bacterium]